jgi:hypothetical protein
MYIFFDVTHGGTYESMDVPVNRNTERDKTLEVK